MKTVEAMTKEDFESLPTLQWNSEFECDSIVIIPKDSLHASGYRQMSFAVVKDGKPFGKVSGGSNAIRIGGIGGYGYNWIRSMRSVSRLVPATAWTMDCLPGSGLLRLWASDRKLITGLALSSFEIFAKSEEEE